MSGEIELIDYGNREAWLKRRMTGVGASESAALFAVSPWHTALSLWAQKTGALAPEPRDEEWLDWGQYLEEPIAARYAAVTKRTVWQGGPYCVAQHKTIKEMLCTPDRWVISAPDKGAPGLLQVKNAGAYKVHDWDEGPPDHIQIQVQHEMAVTGRAWSSVAVLIGGNQFRYFDIERNNDFIAELEAQVQLFWEMVERKEPPAAEEIDRRSLDTLKALHPADNGTIIELPPDALEWWAQVETARKEESAAKKRKEDFDAKLRAAIGDATFAFLPDGRHLSLKTTSRAGFEVNPSTYRTLRLEKESRKRS